MQWLCRTDFLLCFVYNNNDFYAIKHNRTNVPWIPTWTQCFFLKALKE